MNNIKIIGRKTISNKEPEPEIGIKEARWSVIKDKDTFKTLFLSLM